MKFIIIFGLISAAFGDILITPNSTFQEGDRYFYFPGDGDGILHLVDTMEPVDDTFINEYRRGSHRYYLFSRKNPSIPHNLTHGDKDSILKSNFNKLKESVFLIHGWFGNGENKMNKMLTDAFLRKKDVNVIVLDWSKLATRNYMTAKKGVAAIGDELGEFINWLNYDFKVSFNKIHLVGFSLGAHLAGNAGRITRSPVKRITGLDPAGPLWKRDKNRLDKNDAQYVEVIHTNTALYGFSDPCGDADFYPNGGANMPGCWLNMCSHSKGYEYMTASILYNHLLARECFDIQNVYDDNCSGLHYPMGNAFLSKFRSGIFRVNTQENFPF